MAKVSSEGKIPRKIGDYVIYKLDDDYIIRRKSGFTSRKMARDTRFALSRDNASEFGRVSALCKRLRFALHGILPKKNNLAVCNSLVKMMRHLLVYDTQSKRGERHLLQAFENEAALAAFKGYDFNPDSPAPIALKEKMFFDGGGTLQVMSFEAGSSVIFPDGSNSFGMRLHHLDFDFSNGESQRASSEWNFFMDDSLIDAFLLPCAFPDACKGTLLSVLEIQFYFSENGSFVPHLDDSSKNIFVV